MWCIHASKWTKKRLRNIVYTDNQNQNKYQQRLQGSLTVRSTTEQNALHSTHSKQNTKHRRHRIYFQLFNRCYLLSLNFNFHVENGSFFHWFIQLNNNLRCHRLSIQCNRNASVSLSNTMFEIKWILNWKCVFVISRNSEKG